VCLPSQAIFKVGCAVSKEVCGTLSYQMDTEVKATGREANHTRQSCFEVKNYAIRLHGLELNHTQLYFNLSVSM
jgi:hypothetical protein